MSERPLTVADRAPEVGDVLIDPKFPHLWQKRRVIKWLDKEGEWLSFSHYGKNGARTQHGCKVANMLAFPYHSRADSGPITASAPVPGGQRGERDD
jgi:hypothetical protein